MSVRVVGPRAEVLKLLSTVRGVKTVTCVGQREQGSNDYIVEPDGATDVRRQIFTRLADRNWPLLVFKSNEMSLEQIFLRLTDMTEAEQKRIFGKRIKAADAMEATEATTEVEETEEIEEEKGEDK